MTEVVLNMIDGALAQLGARNIRIVEAVGSNPICSILSIGHKRAANLEIFL